MFVSGMHGAGRYRAAGGCEAECSQRGCGGELSLRDNAPRAIYSRAIYRLDSLRDRSTGENYRISAHHEPGNGGLAQPENDVRLIVCLLLMATACSIGPHLPPGFSSPTWMAARRSAS